jgi:hypothetical protein
MRTMTRTCQGLLKCHEGGGVGGAHMAHLLWSLELKTVYQQYVAPPMVLRTKDGLSAIGS